MGWFSNTVADAKLTQEEAFAGVLLGAVAADGEVADEEAAGLTATLTRMRLYDGWSDRDFHRTFRRLSADLRRDGLAALSPRLAEALPADLRVTAFVNACDLVLADGTVEEAESRLIDDLQRHLGVPDEFAAKVVEVVTAKNRG